MADKDGWIEERALDLLALHAPYNAAQAVDEAVAEWNVLMARRYAVRVAMGLEEPDNEVNGGDYDHYGK